MKRSYYVYVLLDPRGFPPKPFYIGISDTDRKRKTCRHLEHYNKKYLVVGSPDYRNHIKSNIIKKLYSLGYKEPYYYILNSGLTSDEAISLEVEYIKRFGRIDLGTGILSNRTDGGDGCRNKALTDEQIKNLSDAQSKVPEKIIRLCLDKRFKDYLTATKISKLPEIKEFSISKNWVQSLIEGKTYKHIRKEYPTLEESYQEYCLKIHIDLQSESNSHVKQKYGLSNGTFTRIKFFDGKWSKYKSYVNDELHKLRRSYDPQRSQ